MFGIDGKVNQMLLTNKGFGDSYTELILDFAYETTRILVPNRPPSLYSK